MIIQLSIFDCCRQQSQVKRGVPVDGAEQSTDAASHAAQSESSDGHRGAGPPAPAAVHPSDDELVLGLGGVLVDGAAYSAHSADSASQSGAAALAARPDTRAEPRAGPAAPAQPGDPRAEPPAGAAPPAESAGAHGRVEGLGQPAAGRQRRRQGEYL